MANILTTLVDRQATRYGDRAAVYYRTSHGEWRPYSWLEMQEMVRKAAAALEILDIKEGSKIAVFSANDPYILITDFAAFANRAVPVSIYATSSAEQVDYIVGDAQAEILFVGSREQYAIARRVAAEQNCLRRIVAYTDFTLDADDSTTLTFSQLLKLGEAASAECLAEVDRRTRSAAADDIATLLYTSGTTGEPKMVAHDFTYPLGHIVTGSFWHNLDENSLHLTIADTGWGKAVWGKLYGQWIAGANIFVYDHEKFTPGDILEKIQNYHVTSLCAPPTIFRFLIHEDLTKFDLSSLKYCTIAGEALNPAVFDTFKKLTGIKLMEGFGQTETTLTIATMPWMQPKPGSMGLPNPQYDVDLIDHEGRSVEAGEQGQIVIRTSKGKPLGLFKEYYRDAERTHEAWHDGIYYTGDVAWKDEDGYLWFVGRADDVIKSSGYRIGPFEVESALMTHPAVVECAITGVPDEIRGQVVKATIVLSKEYKNRAGEELIKELQNHVKKVTAPYKYPRVIEFVEELPKTISGKIRRVEIRENDQK